METLKRHIDESLFSDKPTDAGELSNKIELQYLKDHIHIFSPGIHLNYDDRLIFTIEDGELVLGGTTPNMKYRLEITGDLSRFPYKIKQIKFGPIDMLYFKDCTGLKNFKNIFSPKYSLCEVNELEIRNCPSLESFEGWPDVQAVAALYLDTTMKSYKGVPYVWMEICGQDGNWCINKDHHHSFGVEACLVDVDMMYNALPKCPVKNYMNRELRAYYAKVQSS